MLSTRWEPWSEMNRLSREVERMFGRALPGRSADVSAFPAMNVWEDADHLRAEAELPGFQLSELEIYVTGNQLTIKGQRLPPQHDSGTWHRRERGYGKFARVIELPCDIDGDRVTAEFQHGVLSITLPKSEAVKPRRIEIKTQ